jgi:hypothetical protein
MGEECMVDEVALRCSVGWDCMLISS